MIFPGKELKRSNYSHYVITMQSQTWYKFAPDDLDALNFYNHITILSFTCNDVGSGLPILYNFPNSDLSLNISYYHL